MTQSGFHDFWGETMAPILAFDIETIPDVAGIRRLWDLPSELSETEVVAFAQQKRRAINGSDFMPHHLHQVVAISCCMRYGADKVYIGSIGQPEHGEEHLIAEFFGLIEKHTPRLVSWNGGGFDLPVLHYRALIHGIEAARYWDTGEGDFADSRDFKWNSYINRYHARHCDLMDVLAMYGGRANAPLDELAKLCGFPGKLGMDGSMVADAFFAGQIGEIRDYCETDAANTYLMFLRFQLMNGALDADEYDVEVRRVRQFVETAAARKAHWQAFLAAWDD